MNVRAVFLVVIGIADAVIRETLLPDFGGGFQDFASAKRESALDVLQRFFERGVGRGCKKQMEVIGHDHVFVQEKTPFLPVVVEYLDEQFRHADGLEDGAAIECHGRDEEGAQVLSW